MPARTLQIKTETWPIDGDFRIARGAKTEAHVVVAQIVSDGIVGRSECVPYARYGETITGVVAALDALASAIAGGMSRAELQHALPAGAARNALDCALLDLEAKESNRAVHDILGLPAPLPVRTAFTVSVDTPDRMAKAASAAMSRGYTILKVKVAGQGDLERVAAVRSGAPNAQLILDANEAWSEDDLAQWVQPLARLGVALIEQPLPAGRDDALVGYLGPVPLCADEACHTRDDLARIVGRYSHINVKLDKAGGLTEALALSRAASDLGLRLMIGCMVATSLAMVPALLLASLAEFVDLDGPLLLVRDREPGITYQGDLILPPPRTLWG